MRLLVAAIAVFFLLPAAAFAQRAGNSITSFSTLLQPLQAISQVDSATSSISGQAGVNITSGTPSPSSYALFNVAGLVGGEITVGSFSGTLQIEASYDNGGTYIPLRSMVMGDLDSRTSTITAAGSFWVDLSKATQLRIRATSLTSGTPTITFSGSSSLSTSIIMNGLRLVDSTGADMSAPGSHSLNVTCISGCSGGGGGSSAFVGINGQAAPGSSALQGFEDSSTGNTVQVSNASNSVMLPVYDAQAHADAASPIVSGTNVIGKVGIDQTTPGTTNAVAASITGSCSPYHLSGGTTSGTNSTAAFTTAKTLCTMTVINTSTTISYLKIYDATSATCSSATGIKHVFPIPPASSAGQAGGMVIPLPAQGEAYATGFSFCVTGGGSDTDNTSGQAGIFIEGSFR